MAPEESVRSSPTDKNGAPVSSRPALRLFLPATAAIRRHGPRASFRRSDAVRTRVTRANTRLARPPANPAN